MKIAVPTRGGQIDNHFGHCEYFTVFTLENNVITDQERVDSPEGCGCKSNIASVLATKGVTLLLGGNMGNGALNVLNSNGIQVIRGCSGKIEDVITAWTKGELKDNQQGCNHHGDDGHSCGNHHH